MNIINGIIGGGAAKSIEAVGNVIDKLFTSDDEKLEKKIILERLKQNQDLAQIEINKIEASHDSIFISGWRPFVGWICGIGLLYQFIARPIITGLLIEMPSIDTNLLVSLLGIMMGARTWEKIKNIK